MPKIDLDTAPVREGSSYPAPHDAPCQPRTAVLLSQAVGLTQFGALHLTLPPGAWSSQRHWHAHEDEFVYVLEGEVVLAEDEGETVLKAGDAAGWRAGVQNGHHLKNESDAPARLLVVGSRDDADSGEYPAIDMKFHPRRYSEGPRFTRKNGEPV